MLSSTGKIRRFLADALNKASYLVIRSLLTRLDVGLSKKCGQVTLLIVLSLEYLIIRVMFESVMGKLDAIAIKCLFIGHAQGERSYQL